MWIPSVLVSDSLLDHSWISYQGHDDATAIMLAVSLPNIQLLGVSTVSDPSPQTRDIEEIVQTHGNATSEWTAINAARCLFAFGAPSHVKVYPGAPQPLLLPAKHDPEIHGIDGLGGVQGLPNADDPRVLSMFARNTDGSSIRALEGISTNIKNTWKNGDKVTVISSGPMTNIALFATIYPELLNAVEEFVFMGGAVGIGNRSAVAEYNIMCDRKYVN